MSRSKLVTLLVTVGTLTVFPEVLAAQPTDSLPRDKIARLCWPDLAENDEFSRVDPIPVGCELVDCCPGCPKPEMLSWRIRLSGGPVESAVLDFDNLAPAVRVRLTAEGAARVLEHGTIRIGKGESLVRGLPGIAAGPPPVGQMRFIFDRTWGQKKLQESAQRERMIDAGEADAVEVIVEQLLGDVVVNEYLLKYQLRFCATHASDHISLLERTGPDQAIAIVDARAGNGQQALACVVDALFPESMVGGAPSINVGLMTSNGACRSEVAVFSYKNAVPLITGVNRWTPNNGDVLGISMPPPLMTQVAVWLARPNAAETAGQHVGRANAIFFRSKTGVRFRHVTMDRSALPDAVNTIGKKCRMFDQNGVFTTASGAAAVIATSTSTTVPHLFKAGMLNVYYVDNLSLTGETCGADGNIIYIGTQASLETLAHEFGHSMSLEHNLDGSELDTTNVMWPEVAGRKRLSLGQGFRANFECASILKLNSSPTKPPVRNCPNVNTVVTTLVSPSAAENCAEITDTHCPPNHLDLDGT